MFFLVGIKAYTPPRSPSETVVKKPLLAADLFLSALTTWRLPAALLCVTSPPSVVDDGGAGATARRGASTSQWGRLEQRGKRRCGHLPHSEEKEKKEKEEQEQRAR